MDKLVKKVLRFRKKNKTKTPVEEFMERENTEQRVISFLGHSVEDSPIYESSTQEDLKYSQESDENIQLFDSYVTVIGGGENGFDTKEVHGHSAAIAAFVRLPLSISILSVPGVTINDANVFQKHGIHSTHNLIGQYILLYGEAGSQNDYDMSHVFFSDNASSTIFTILISLHPLVSFYNTKTNMSKILGFILTQKSTRGDCSLKNRAVHSGYPV